MDGAVARLVGVGGVVRACGCRCIWRVVCGRRTCDAVRAVRPFGLDLCSGVRSNGRLDAVKLGRFSSRRQPPQHACEIARKHESSGCHCLAGSAVQQCGDVRLRKAARLGPEPPSRGT